jgi:uncharacterized membrane protein (UPF0127 family)
VARKVIVFKEPGEKAVGALGLQSPIPANYVLFFVGADPGTVVHMRGMREPLQVFFLDGVLSVISSITLQPEDAYLVPQGTRYVTELSTKAQPPADFAFLRNYL